MGSPADPPTGMRRDTGAGTAAGSVTAVVDLTWCDRAAAKPQKRSVAPTSIGAGI
jgi:hypothetical protein